MSAQSSGAVLRMAVRPRWLALLGVVIVLCVVFGALGRWQLHVAEAKGHHHTAAAAADAAVVPLRQVVGPQQVFRTNMVGRHVTVQGSYDVGRQLLVAGQVEPGASGGSARQGYWVLTALRTADGAYVPIVRGWVAATTPAPPAPPTGTQTVAGSLQPPETTNADPAATALPAGQISAADTAALVNVWGGPIYNVLVYAAPAPAPLRAVPAPPPDDSGGLRLLNAAYAVQWWLFGAFALLLWWRMVRQATLDAAAAPTGAPATEKELSTT